MQETFINLSLLEHFSELEDPRIDRHKKYPLNEILLLTLSAVIAGADGWAGIEQYGLFKIDFLRTLLPFKSGIPSHDTLGRVFTIIDSKKFSDLFTSWTQSLLPELSGLVHLDGKTLRRSSDEERPLQLINAFSSKYRLVLAQEPVAKGRNEVSTLPLLIDSLQLSGAVVTIDAAGCQKAIAQQLIDKESDYVLALKKNHKNLLEIVESYFDLEINDGGKFTEKLYNVSFDKGHGRIEKRECWTAAAKDVLPPDLDWAGIASVSMIEASRTLSGKTSRQRRFYISSLEPDASRMNTIIRSHWSIENSLHWVLDVSFREDLCRIRKGNAAENMAIVRKVGLNLCKAAAKEKKVSIVGMRRMAGWSDQVLRQVLNQKF